MKKVILYFPWLGALLLIAVVLLCFEPDLLWKVQQNNLFLDTALFFKEQMVVPGGFLSYIGCYFTQFFYHPWLGVLMLCGWWLLLMWLTKCTFRIADNWTVLALVPVAVLLIANMDLGYWHYFMRLHGYFYVATFGTIAGVVLLWTFRALPQKPWLRIAYIVVAAVVGYPLLGIYGLATVLLMGVWNWRLNRNRTQNIILTVVALLCIIAVPLFCYRYIYYQTYFDDLWTIGLPILNTLRLYPAYYIPYYILGGFFLLMVIFYQISLPAKWQKPFYRWSLQGILALVLVFGVWHWWYKDADFHHEIVMQHCIEESDWEGVINEGKKQGDEEPTRSIVMMYNLALSWWNRIDEMYEFPWGKKKGDPSFPHDVLNNIFSRVFFYQYGQLNDCHRKCMEDGVEYGWKVETLQYMARCAILSGEKQAAQKALNLLRHTIYYGEWADSMQQLLDHPEQIADNRETGSVSHMLQYKDALGYDKNDVENYIMTLLAYQDSDDPYFQQQAVLATLWKRNPNLFWPRFNRYTHMFPKGPIPRIFQEAAILFGNIENRPNVNNLPFDKGVRESFAAFVKECKQYDGKQAIVGRTALHPAFGNTYYFYYYFLQDMK